MKWKIAKNSVLRILNFDLILMNLYVFEFGKFFEEATKREMTV